MRCVTGAYHRPKADLNSLQLHCRHLPALPHFVCHPSKRLQAEADINSPRTAHVSQTRNSTLSPGRQQLVQGACMYVAPGPLPVHLQELHASFCTQPLDGTLQMLQCLTPVPSEGICT